MKIAAVILLALAAIAGCGSTVLLGSVDGAVSTDMAIGIDITVAVSPGDGFDFGIFDLGIFDLGTDATAPVDLAQ